MCSTDLKKLEYELLLAEINKEHAVNLYCIEINYAN